MSELDEHGRPRPGAAAGPEDEAREEALTRLLQTAGPRPGIPERLMPQLTAAAREAWQSKAAEVARARHRRRAWGLAAAAVLVLALGWALRGTLGPAAGGEEAAVVAAIFPANAPLALEMPPGTSLPAGRRLTTPGGVRLTLELTNGAQVRLDQRSRLVVGSQGRLELDRGALYADSGGKSGDSLEIRTPFGLARDIGTRFAVRLEGRALSVWVRDGEVSLDTAGELHRASAGTALILQDGVVERRRIAPFGNVWDWTQEAAPSFDLEGRTLREFLDWVSDETGRTVRFEDPALASRAERIVTHGSLEGLRPEEALAVVLPSSGLSYRLEAGEIRISP